MEQKGSNYIQHLLISFSYIQPTSKYVKKELAKEIIAKAGPLLTWLEEAEEESDDEEEKEADVVVSQHLFFHIISMH